MHKRIVANWKSHKTVSEVEKWIKTFSTQVTSGELLKKDVEVVLAPSFLFLGEAMHWVQEKFPSNVVVAAQDISPFPFGAYTGAVAAQAVESLGVTYAVVGHSERRRYFGETNVHVANKIEQCLEVGITPIVCVDLEYVVSQAMAIDSKLKGKCIVAYEPLEAIGSGSPQDPREVESAVMRIKDVFGDVEVLYGGSVTAKTVSEYLEITDGVIVGGASLDVHEFIQLLTPNGTEKK